MTKETLKQSIMEEVTKGDVEQKSTQYFMYREYAIWGIAGLSVLVGTIAMALVFAAAEDLRNTLRALNVSGTEGLLLIPYVWIVTIIGFLALGYAQIRDTKRGYRYPLWMLALILIVVSGFGGAIVYTTGFAHHTDQYLAEKLSVYRQYGNPQHAIWRAPDKGFLAGKILSVGTSTCGMKDIRGVEWKIDLSMVTGTLLAPDVHAKFVGEKIGEDEFKAMRVYVRDSAHRPAPMPRERKPEPMRTR